MRPPPRDLVAASQRPRDQRVGVKSSRLLPGWLSEGGETFPSAFRGFGLDRPSVALLSFAPAAVLRGYPVALCCSFRGFAWTSPDVRSTRRQRQTRMQLQCNVRRSMQCLCMGGGIGSTEDTDQLGLESDGVEDGCEWTEFLCILVFHRKKIHVWTLKNFNVIFGPFTRRRSL
jgi:hypothetical protein